MLGWRPLSLAGREFGLCASDAFAVRYVAARDRSEAGHNTFIHAGHKHGRFCVEVSLGDQNQ